MSTLTIHVDKEQFIPLEHIKGKVSWNVNEPPRCVTLHVGWHTAGRGTKDSCVEYEQEWTTDQLTGEEPFSFSLPHAPYSFAGKLIELMWYISLEVDKGDTYTLKDIVVGPKAQRVNLA